MTADRRVEDLLRQSTPQVLGALVRRFGRFDMCEDAVQEALLAATSQSVAKGPPDNPTGWLVTVATRRYTDRLRSDIARQRRERFDAMAAPPASLLAPPADAGSPGGDGDGDDD